jgi:hypothetical protein
VGEMRLWISCNRKKNDFGRFEQKNTKNEFLYLTAQFAESNISDLSAMSLTNMSSGIFLLLFQESSENVESQVPIGAPADAGASEGANRSGS